MIMPKQIPTEEDKKKALERAKREFPGNKALQELHYIRYLLEIEWKNMTIEEIQEEVRKAKQELGLDKKSSSATLRNK
jgi:hypothetical protein